MRIPVLTSAVDFPDPRHADEDGLVAVGGDLSPARILEAYARGIFPWPLSGGVLAWFSPHPRMVLEPRSVRVSRSLRKTLRSGELTVTMDTAFQRVIERCARIRRAHETGTWIHPGMVEAYIDLHRAGYAHSVETWQGDRLVGGLYGVSIGSMFCGESMFHEVTDASKVAFVALARQLDAWTFDMLDCQLHTPHLASLGAHEIGRTAFLERLENVLSRPTRVGEWSLDPDLDVPHRGG